MPARTISVIRPPRTGRDWRIREKAGEARRGGEEKGHELLSLRGGAVDEVLRTEEGHDPLADEEIDDEHEDQGEGSGPFQTYSRR